MKKNKHLLILILFSFCSNLLFAQQLKWNVIDDSISLTPNRIKANGFFVYSKANSSAEVQLNGEFTILLKEQQVFYNDGSNLFKLTYNDIRNINLDGIKYFTNNDLNQKYLNDTIIYNYRRSLYNHLDLNEIEVLLSKKNKFELVNGDLKIRNPNYINGKICAISFENIVILTSEGELISLNDGDFVNINVQGKKYMECSSLYNFCFKYFTNDLVNIKENFTNKIKENGIENLVNYIGPYEKVQILPNNNKLYVWSKALPKYYINLSTTASSFSRFSSFSNFTLNTSPIFSYTNSYRFLNSNTFGSNSTSTKITQGGEVSTVDEGQVLALTLDLNGKIVSVYQERLFAEPNYGLPFRFISY